MDLCRNPFPFKIVVDAIFCKLDLDFRRLRHILYVSGLLEYYRYKHFYQIVSKLQLFAFINDLIRQWIEHKISTELRFQSAIV